MWPPSGSYMNRLLCSLLPPAWDCSAWVRTYALYLDERVECFRVLKYDVEADRLLKLPQASGKVSFSMLSNQHLAVLVGIILSCLTHE